MALGATAFDIRRRILADGMRLGTVAVAIGLVGATFLARVASSMMFGVDAAELTPYFVGGAVVLGTVVLSCLWASRKVNRFESSAALRDAGA